MLLTPGQVALRWSSRKHGQCRHTLTSGGPYSRNVTANMVTPPTVALTNGSKLSFDCYTVKPPYLLTIDLTYCEFFCSISTLKNRIFFPKK
jgi:hypothetical protein